MKPQNSNQDNQISGLLCIDKPEGCTSFDVVRKVRRALSVRRVGHGGTLDPLATGLLVVLVGKASKLQDIVMGGVKRYQGTIKVGTATDTDDITGETLSTSTENFNLCSTEFRDRIAQIAVKYTGQIDQIPPQYSSIKVQGKRSYALARSGKSVEHRPRQVEIYQLELEAVSESELSYNLVCSKGTYVRSLARDIGEDLGLGACVKSIRRVGSGGFNVDAAMKFSELDSASNIERQLISMEQFASDLPSLEVTRDEMRALEQGDQRPLTRAGMVLEPNAPGEPKMAKIIDENSRFRGMLRQTPEGSWNLWFLV